MSAVVIGGGLAGLVSAYRLALEGRAVTLLEASPSVGGMISAVDVGGIRVDSGAEAYAVRGGVARALCEEVGLEVAAPLGAPHVFFDEGAFPMADGVLGIPSHADDPAFGALTGQQRAQALRDLELPATLGAGAVSVGELVEARMGPAAVQRLVGPVATSIYGADPYKLAVADVAPGLVPAMQEHGSLMGAVAAVRAPGAAAVEQPVGGMFRLIEQLVVKIRASGGRIRTKTAAVTIRRHGSGFAVATKDRDLEASQVVLATPAAAACALLGRVGVEFSVPAVRQARLVTMAVKHPGLLEAPIGSGALVARPPDALSARAITHYSVKWPWSQVGQTSVLRLSYPGVAVPRREEAVTTAARLTGVAFDDGDVVGMASVGWNAMPSRIEASRREYLIEAAADVGVDVVGSWIDGNGIASVIAGCGRVLR